MANLVTLTSEINKRLQNPYRGRSPEELDDIIASAQPNKAQQALGAVSDVFMQRAGLQPIKRPQDDALNSYITKALIKQQLSPSKASSPILKNVGGNLVSYDPESGEAKTIMEAPAKPKAPKIMKVGNQVISIDQDSGEASSLFETPTQAGENLTPGQKNLKIKDTNKLMDTLKTNEVKRKAILEAQGLLDSVPKGLGGALWVKGMNMMGKESPQIENWQKLKSVLTDAQLMNTAKTKGAISDKEMMLFAQAAANDDVMAVSRMRPVLEKLSSFIDAETEGAKEAYTRNYGIDPNEWTPTTSRGATQPKPTPTSTGQMPSFATEEEAAAANLTPGTPIMINGRRAIWE
jgi:hypothetical protein